MSTPDDDDRTVIRPSGLPAGAPEPIAAPTVAMPAPVAHASAIPGAAAAPAAPAAPEQAPLHDGGNALPVGTVLAEFELTSVVGEGGFGIVYLAQDRQLQRRVALKEFMPSSLAARTSAMQVGVKSARHRETFELALRSFVNEARALAQFDHPSLVKVYRFWEANGTAYMVMPFYEGLTLQETVRARGMAPDETWLMTLLDPLTAALAVIHEAQWYHRDIAPDNILLLAGSGAPLLLDFGAARRVIGGMTQALTVILKPGYAPLEQYAEVPHMKQGPWTDIYALAAVVYWCITGKTPPPSVARVLNDPYVPLAQSMAGRYSPRFLQAVDRALTVKPDERTASIAQFRADLGLDGTAATAPLAGAKPPPAGAAAQARTSTPAAAAAPASGAPAAPASAQAGNTGSTGKWALIGGAGVLVAAGALYAVLRSPAPPPSDAPPGAPTGAQVAATSPAAPGPTAQPSATPPAVVATAPPATAATTPGATSSSTSTPEVTPTPAAAGTGPATGPLDTVAELRRMVTLQSSGYAVTAEPVKSPAVIGRDKLSFRLTSARDGHYYVYAIGPDGVLYLLLPNTQARDNRIRAGQTLTLPPKASALDVAEPAGPERLFVVVSDSPRDFKHLAPKSEGWFRILPTGAAAQALAAARAPGSPPLYLGTPVCETKAADCSTAYGAAAFEIQVVR